MGNIGGSKSSALRVSHELQSFLEDLVETVFDVHSKVLGDIILEICDSDGFGNIFNRVGVPENRGGHPGVEGRIAGLLLGG